MHITLLPQQLKIEFSPGQTLLQALAQAGLMLDAACGGRGSCGQCRVRLLSRPLPTALPREAELFSTQQLADGWRLACLQRPTANLDIELPEQVLLTDKGGQLTLPADFKPDRQSGLGLAFDLGTTTVAGLLWDLESGRLLGSAALPNPQGGYGADVMSRISFALASTENLKLLQKIIVQCLDQLASLLAQQAGRSLAEITRLVCVANTTMSHLLLGYAPQGLAHLPFQPSFAGSQQRTAAQLGLQQLPATAQVQVLPNLAAHVGSDITAGLLATGLQEQPGNHLLLDIGTNGEIVLASQGRLLVCSTAAGPVFEGAGIRHGKRAAPGAICAASLEGGQLQLFTIENAPANGICGAGLLDLIAVFLQAGLILPSGKIAPAAQFAAIAPQLTPQREADGLVIPLTERITLHQQDIRLVQLGKGAMRAGIELLLLQAGRKAADLAEILLAGAFGNHIRIASAQRLGLLPPLPAETIRQVGHTAGLGASLALLAQAKFEQANTIPAQVEHVELAEQAAFQQTYLEQMGFPAP